jgi:hypothetical protein
MLLNKGNTHLKRKPKLPLIMSKSIFMLFVLFVANVKVHIVANVLFDELPLQKYPLEWVGHNSLLCEKPFFP